VVSEETRGTVKVFYQDRLGNTLAQYCLGRIIAEGLGFNLRASPIPGFPDILPLERGVAQSIGPSQPLEAHRIDLAAILADRTPRRVILNGYFQRYEYFQPATRAFAIGSRARSARKTGRTTSRSTFARATSGRRAPRRAESTANTTRCRSFYDAILRSQRWGRVTVVTEDRSDPMVQKLAASFDAEVRSGSAFEDFNRLRSSANLILSVSSYAWLAGWLSSATRLFFPVAGVFDRERVLPRDFAWQQDLWIHDEPRFVAIRPVALDDSWTGSDEMRQRLLVS
jgi:hypothetical protein